ncbi:hypothetical protein U2150_07640 [Methanothermobacter wolfeii]|uniref:Uncharacterized protein n=1 Tax=Methanothermobacter wolfeii TaxID=145261 RepID=A0A9E7RXY0_METWO|nr:MULTISPECIES: hypothetical protein [Methanothermobacter]NLM02914.1 hypothetical protein [Methanothermobacter wolfeii]QHN06228.1 hypothetical protein FZP57_03530 [Methanothermobacter sp. THM-1]UXH32429.1 hypothetical protein N5910_03865 [Methanothermobacter wolfeii]
MNIIKIASCLEKNNIVFCGGSVRETYQEITEALRDQKIPGDPVMVYIPSPMPLKAGLMMIMRSHDPEAPDKLTVNELLERLSSLESMTWVFMDHFEDLSEKASRKYLWLHENGNITYMTGLTGTFRREVYPFYRTFRKANPSECMDEESVDVTVAVFAVISIIIAFCYFRVGVREGFMAAGALWFGLITFRTMTYIAG